MKEYIIIGILVLVILVSFYLLMQFKRIREKTYKWFLKAEHKCISGEDKMNYVIDNLYPYLPFNIRIFISENTFRNIIQTMFDEIKDLLDDGKFNKSNSNKESD
jgi:hypothetical protein